MEATGSSVNNKNRKRGIQLRVLIENNQLLLRKIILVIYDIAAGKVSCYSKAFSGKKPAVYSRSDCDYCFNFLCAAAVWKSLELCRSDRTCKYIGSKHSLCQRADVCVCTHGLADAKKLLCILWSRPVSLIA